MKKKARKYLLIASAIGVAHFAVSLLLWGIALFVAHKQSQNSPQNWNEFLKAIPALMLFLLFITAFICIRRGVKASVCIFITSLVLTIGAFTYDISNRNYQMHVENMSGDNQGGTFKYFTWWWYNHY